jgi:hypothetical protein
MLEKVGRETERPTFPEQELPVHHWLSQNTAKKRPNAPEDEPSQHARRTTERKLTALKDI